VISPAVPIAQLMYSGFVSAGLKCPVRAKLNCQTTLSEDVVREQGLDWVTMSGRELQRIEILSEVLARRHTRDGGGGALIHKARGSPSNNRIIFGVREYVIELIRSRYADFEPTLAIGVLLDKQAIKVGRETSRTWMVEDGLSLSRKQRKSLPRA
jgi:hypothetical protein